jgi:hypothetical protein
MRPLGEKRLMNQWKQTVKSLYYSVKPLRQYIFNSCNEDTKLTNPTITRRQNALELFQAYAEKSLAAGTSPKGLEQAFAASLQISPSMWSQIKSARPIGDKLARQIEVLCGKPAGWLDEARDTRVITPAEQVFLDLALAAWRAANGAGKKALREQLKAVSGGSGAG